MYENKWANSGNASWNTDSSYNFSVPQSNAPSSIPSSVFYTRQSPNYIATIFAIIFVVCYLFLPFVKFAFFIPVNGIQFMSKLNALMCIPLILGLLMLLSSLFLDPKLSIGIGSLTTVILLIMFLCSRSIVISGNGINQLLYLAGTDYGPFSHIGEFVPVSIGIGGVLSIMLCLLFVFIEGFLPYGLQRRIKSTVGNEWPTA